MMRLSKFIQRLQDMQAQAGSQGDGEDHDPHVVVSSTSNFTDAELEPAGVKVVFIRMHGKSNDAARGPFVFAHPDEGESAIQII